jgi:hypothetical protein
MTTTWVPTLPAADSFGSRLRLLRLALDDESVDALAKRCDIPTATWRTWEKGTAMPQRMAAVVEKIHRATGVDRAWLMWGEVSSDLLTQSSAWTKATNVLSLAGRPYGTKRTTANVARPQKAA